MCTPLFKSDESLRGHADDVEDKVLDLETPADNSDFLSNLTASEAWVARLHGRTRATSKVQGKEEWDYFNSNILSFQGQTDEADNYTNIRFSDFAKHWNEMVDSLGTSKPSITYKNAAYLNDAYKRSARRANQDTTKRAHSEALKLVRQQNNDASVTQSFSNRFADVERAITARPASVARHDVGTQTSDSDGEDPGAQADDERDNEMLTHTKAGRKRKKKSNPKASSGHRCRTCGHVYTLPEWKKYHIIPKNETYNTQFPLMRHLPNQAESKVYEHCTVPEHMRKEGFPVPPGKPMPRKKRTRTSR